MRFKEIALGATVLILLLSIWWAAARWYERTLVEEQRLRVLTALTPYGNSLTTAINQRLLLLEGLKNFTIIRSRSGKDIDPAEFSSFAAGIYSVSKGIRVIHLSPGGVNRYVYPLEGNQAVPGHDLLHDQRPQVRQDVQRTIQTRRIALSDPYELRQGGMGLVARLAIYRKDDFWGLAVIILDVPPILTAAGLDQRLPGLELSIRDRTHRVFFGRDEVFSSQPIIYPVALPEGSWQMAAIPAGGWKAAVSERLRMFQGGGLFFVGLLFSLAFLVASRQRSLTQAIAERTMELERELAQRKQKEQDLQESEERYRSFFDHSIDAVLLTAPDGRILQANPEACRIFGRTEEEIRQVGRAGVIDPTDPRLAQALEERKRTSRFKGELNFVRKDGTSFPGEISSAVFTDRDGNIRTSMIIRDITQRNQMEEKIKSQLEELQRWQDVMLDREDRVLELKKEINGLLVQAGHPPRYPSAEEDSKK